MGDFRSLIEFLRNFEQRRVNGGSASPPASARKRGRLINPPPSPSPNNRHTFCEHSAFLVLDVFLLLLAVGAVGFLVSPYIRLLLVEAASLVAAYPFICLYAAGVAALLAISFAVYDFLSHYARKCGKPTCKGLKKAVEIDIQLETEECVRGYPTLPPELRHLSADSSQPTPPCDDRKELEAELRKMAPPNGRTVLIFRSPCGCPKERLEVWGTRKVRRIKK